MDEHDHTFDELTPGQLYQSVDSLNPESDDETRRQLTEATEAMLWKIKAIIDRLKQKEQERERYEREQLGRG